MDVVQAIVVGGLLAFFTANQITASRILRFSTSQPARTIFTGIIQGFFIGAALAFITMYLILDDKVEAIQTTTTCAECRRIDRHLYPEHSSGRP